MPHDPYKSCWGCPKPRPCDRSACDGWQSRQAEKQIRYDLREKSYASRPVHKGYFKMVEKRRRDNQLKGK